MKISTFAVLCVILINNSFGQNESHFIELAKNGNDILREVLNEADKYELQIIYTQINRENGNPSFNKYLFRVNSQDYFYPASTIKFPAALLSLEKINNLKIPGLTKETHLRIDSAFSRQSKVFFDYSSEDSLPTIAHYIKKLFIVSDNDAFNRLYEFLGQKDLNENLWEKGYKNINLTHRLATARTTEENRHTNPFVFYKGNEIIYEQSLQYNSYIYSNNLLSAKKGIGYLQGDSLINEPKDFSASNYVSLEVLHEFLLAVFFPESIEENKRFNLTDDDYKFLYKYMSMLPRESNYPSYSDTTYYYDGYVKFFMYGDTKENIPDNIKIYNKVGLAYGYMIDNAYIIDTENNIEFLLSAVIYVNEDGILNDNKYEYDEIGLPFLAELGRVIYNYELNRKK